MTDVGGEEVTGYGVDRFAAVALPPGLFFGALQPAEAPTVDAAWKWRGIGLFGEYYWRLLDGFRGTGTFTRSSVFDHGAMGPWVV